MFGGGERRERCETNTEKVRSEVAAVHNWCCATTVQQCDSHRHINTTTTTTTDPSAALRSKICRWHMEHFFAVEQSSSDQTSERRGGGSRRHLCYSTTRVATAQLHGPRCPLCTLVPDRYSRLCSHEQPLPHMFRYPLTPFTVYHCRRQSPRRSKRHARCTRPSGQWWLFAARHIK